MSNCNAQYKLTDDFDIDRLKETSVLYERIIRNNFSFIINRFNNNPDYPWIDTKYDLIHARDFDHNDPVRGAGTVYCWIQGRALESLSAYAKWLSCNHQKANSESIESIHKILKTVLQNLKKARDKNKGRLYFTMNPEGDFFKFDENFNKVSVKTETDSPYNFSDMFCSRGMLCAAVELNDTQLIEYARQYCLDVHKSLGNNFKNDQYTFPGQSKQKNLTSAKSFGPFMIYLATANLLYEINPSKNAQMGMDLIDHILDNHTNLDGKINNTDKYTVFEYVDTEGKPYMTDCKLISDPGHALEFVGLSLKFCREALRNTNPGKLIKYYEYMPEILKTNFDNGFNEGIGICKRVDLLTKTVVDGYMPWWSLPETMRAAIQCCESDVNIELSYTAREIFAKCSNAFIKNYIVKDNYHLAYQTLDDKGRPADIIPAVPDLDPGYHTCLSLMDCIDTINNLD